MNIVDGEHGRPTMVSTYRNAEGDDLFHILRWDFIDEDGAPSKKIRPATFCESRNGHRAWSLRAMPSPRPLYGLHEIVVRADAMVLIAEGEKTCNAAARLFPDMVATTSAFGSKAVHTTDFSPLAGRVVVIATDNDEEGQDFGDRVYSQLNKAGAARILHLKPDVLGTRTWHEGQMIEREEDLPAGWDLYDAFAEGWTADKVKEVIPNPESLPDYVAGGAAWPFRFVAEGVEFRCDKVDRRTGEVSSTWIWICSPLEVIALTRNGDSKEWGRLLRFTDPDGIVHEWVMPMTMLCGDGAAYREVLLSKGLTIATAKFAQEALQLYLSSASPTERVRTVNRIGWSKGSFILPDRTITAKPADEAVLYQGYGSAQNAYGTRGTLAGWQEGIARLAIGNSRLAAAISMAFVGPLLDLVDAESGGFNFRGPSSIGKTTAVIAAASVWGGSDYIRSWRATSNGLEGVAQAHNDTLLILDEMGQCSSREVGEVAYMLANGQGKQRAGKTGESRPRAKWRLALISTSEVSVRDKMAEDRGGRHTMAGQEVRIIDLRADAETGRGLFETLHGHGSADALARHLKAMASQHHGHAAAAFLDHLVAKRDEVAADVKRMQEDFVTANCPTGSDGQVKRAAGRFGLVAAAGELATSLGILPWEPDEATRAALACFKAWLEVRGGVEAAEVRNAIARIRHYIEQHGRARFETEPTDDNIDFGKMSLRSGILAKDKDGNEVLCFLPEVWRETCRGMDPTYVAKVLATKGMLNAGPHGRLQKQRRIKGIKNPIWLYEVNSNIFEHHDPANDGMATELSFGSDAKPTLVPAQSDNRRRPLSPELKKRLDRLK